MFPGFSQRSINVNRSVTNMYADYHAYMFLMYLPCFYVLEQINNYRLRSIVDKDSYEKIVSKRKFICINHFLLTCIWNCFGIGYAVGDTMKYTSKKIIFFDVARYNRFTKMTVNGKTYFVTKFNKMNLKHKKYDNMSYTCGDFYLVLDEDESDKTVDFFTKLSNGEDFEIASEYSHIIVKNCHVYYRFFNDTYKYDL